MDITVEQAEGDVGVTILRILGELDGSNFQDLISKGKEVHAEGARHLLIDMSEMPFMSSAGLVALHSLSLLVQGKEPLNPEAGWAALSAVGIDRDKGMQGHVKLLSPQASVDKVLSSTGMKDFFEVYTDLDAALASYS